MAFKVSTFAESSATQEPIVTPTITETAVEPIVETPIVEPIKETSETIVTENGELKTPEAVVESKVETPVVEENTSTFAIPDFLPNAEIKTEVPTTDWKDVLKSVNAKEILKELGVNDFAIEMNDYITKGGKPEDYITAKGFDYNKVPDNKLALEALKEEYPHLKDDAEKLNKIFVNRYKQGENVDDEERELGEIQMQADAHKYRVRKIQEQQAFKMPETKQDLIDPMQAQIAQQQAERTIKFFTEHQATQDLIKSKRVAINLGEGIKPFNFNVDKPEALVKPMVDAEAWQRIISVNPQETDKTKLIPDVAKLQRLILIGLNPNYEKDIYNAGISAGEKRLVDEGKNAVRPITKPNIPTKETLAQAFKIRAKVSTYGA